MDSPDTIYDWEEQWTPKGKHYFLPNMSTTVDAFGKSFWSLLLSDMGVYDETNALATADGIDFLQSRNDTGLRTAAAEDDSDEFNIGTITRQYNPEDGATRATSNHTNQVSTLFAQYLCSVPKQKGGFSLFFSVLLADIVFLNACWKVFGWVATYLLGRRDPYFNCCERCISKMSEGKAQEGHGRSRPHQMLQLSSMDRVSTRSNQPLMGHQSEARRHERRGRDW